ncbi:MAG: hypothetical protein A4S16_05480 [Proteobacteria bacterium SG_bin6]|nr:MAG: hypothetical protein A4S16_05480 [Proteobacteria bacterium SG_bin6]
MNVVLSCYPLSTELSRAVDRVIPTGRALSLASLRVLSLRRLFAELRGVRADEIVVVLSATTEHVLLPILLLVAAFTRSGTIKTLDITSGAVRSVPRWRAFFGIFASVNASIGGRIAKLRCERQARHLLRVQPLQFGAIGGATALYLKSNLMFGTHAGGSVGHIAGVANELFRRSPDSVMAAIEFPAMVRSDMNFAPIAAIGTYGVPRESNNLRFNANCISAGARVLSKQRFDFIYQRLTIGSLAGVILSRTFKTPLVIEYNGSEVWIADNWGLKLVWRDLMLQLEEVCLRHAHRIVVVSDVLADELVSRGVPANRIINYPNCIDPTVFDPAAQARHRQPLRERLGFVPNDFVCTFVGTFGAWHGADVLADAIRRFLAEPTPPEGKQLRFLMVGDGIHAPAARALLADEIASGKVIFTGLVPQHEAPAYLAASDAFLSPHVRPADGSRLFGSPTKLFEYMAMGRPIIASGLEQISEVLTPSTAIDEADGLAVPPPDALAIITEPGSVDDIVRGLRILRDRVAWREGLGAAAQQKALAAYTWRQHVDRIFMSLAEEIR